jgi:hypothetical protein
VGVGVGLGGFKQLLQSIKRAFSEINCATV